MSGSLPRRVGATALVLLLTGGTPLGAERRAGVPEVVVFAGGWGPEGTQATLEADAARLVERIGPERVRLLFADGGSARSVQTVAPTDMVSARLGLLFGRSEGLGVTYRRPKIASEGPASPEAVVRALVGLARRPGGGVAFGAGHGGAPAGDAPATLELWGASLDPRALAHALDTAPARGPLALVLGQCHSGAFADVAHVGGDPSAPLATPARCVLASVPAELEAAGCSPDASDPDARAFLHAVAEALDGRADYDGDARVGLDEALAYARLHDATVDVPVRSSELWLERRRAGGPVSLGGVRLVDLTALADPGERAVLEGLAHAETPESMETRLEELIERAAALDEAVAAAEADLEEARRRALARVFALWPELAGPLHPRSRQLLAGEAPEIMRLWREEPATFAALEEADGTMSARATERWTHERAAARVDRWVRTARAVWGRRSLDPESARQLEHLRACERRPLGRGAPPVRPAQPGGRGAARGSR